MGQMTLALLVGAELPSAFLAEDDSWEKLDELMTDWKRSYHTTVEVPYQAGRNLIGFYAAVGASGRDGLPDFLYAATPLDELTETFKTSIKRAWSQWQKFEAFAQKRGFSFGEAKLWVTPTEVA